MESIPASSIVDLTSATDEASNAQQQKHQQERAATMKKARPSSFPSNDAEGKNHTEITPPLNGMNLASQEADSTSASHDRELSSNTQHDPSPNMTSVFASVQA
jgi:hypothetical protein